EAATQGKGIQVGVTIDFMHNDEQNKISRYFSAIKDENGKIHQDFPYVKLTNNKENSNTDYCDESKSDEIHEISNSILDEQVKNYFLLDGERIESLTKASKKQKENIQTGIKNLLKIDNLFLLNQALEQHKKDLNSELKKISTGEMLSNIQKVEEKDERLAEIQLKIDTLIENLNIAENQKADIDRELKEIEDQRPILNKIMDLEKEIDTLKLERNKIHQEMVELTPSLSVMLAKDPVGELIADLEGQRIRGEVP